MRDYKTVTQPPEHLTPNQLYINSMTMGVTVPVTQNAFGGIGAFLVTSIIGWRAGMTTEAFLILGGTIGGLLFGVACMIRAFRDEVRFMLGALGERQDRAARSALEAEVMQLRSEMRRLRSQGVISAQYEVLMACERLLSDYFERHLDITRSAALSRGYTRALWDASMKVLRTAQVIDGQGGLRAASFPEAWTAVLRSQSAGMGTFVVTDAKDLVRTK